jgi:hypothetical protein
MMIIRRSLSLALATALFVATHAGVASAQNTTDTSLGISYSFLRFLEGPDLNVPAGWLISFAKPIARSPIAVVGEAAGNYRSEFGETLRVHTYQAGLRLLARTAPGVDPFAQFLAGGMTVGCCGESATNFMIEPGVGVDFGMGRGLALRAGVSFPIAFADGGAINALRLQAGVVLPISSR